MSHGHATIKMFSSFGCALCIVAKGTVLKEKDTAQYTCACFEAIKEKRKILSIFRRNTPYRHEGIIAFLLLLRNPVLCRILFCFSGKKRKNAEFLFRNCAILGSFTK